MVTDDDIESDEIVRGTVARMRASVLVVVLGAVALSVLAAIGMRMAWSAGRESVGAVAPTAAAAASAGASAAPTALAEFAIVAAGFAMVATAMFWFVRAPAARARTQAIELLLAQHQIAESTLETFAALNAAVEAKDRYTAGHGLRVTLVSILIGQEMGLAQDELDVLRHAATFHDIGKIAVPDAVLLNPGKLTDSEYDAMKIHPVEGARICGKLQALRPVVDIVRSHHERMDGRGYPDGLVASRIPLGARIIAVADAWDAITSDRPYRQGQPAFVALEEIRRCSGSQFDEQVVRSFIEVLAKDPWMFGLTPEDLSERGRLLPIPEPTSRGAEDLGRGRPEPELEHAGEIDWTNGFDEEDLRAA